MILRVIDMKQYSGNQTEKVIFDIKKEKPIKVIKVPNPLYHGYLEVIVNDTKSN